MYNQLRIIFSSKSLDLYLDTNYVWEELALKKTKCNVGLI